MFLAIFSNSLRSESLSDGSTRIVLKIPIILAPNQCAILPLIKKDGLPELAKQIKNKLKLKYKLVYDDKDAIGRRYRRQDALGTPFCVTLDHQTLEDKTVTVRERDSMTQKRLKIDELDKFLFQSFDISNWLK